MKQNRLDIVTAIQAVVFADGYIQAYNFRYYTTDDPEHRIPLTAPLDYDASEFE